MTLLETDQHRLDRHKLVLAAVAEGKSNRAIATLLNVDEGTIRNDRKFLATPVSLRPVRKVVPRKVKAPASVPLLRPGELERRRVDATVEVIRKWFEEEGFLVPDCDFILDRTSKRLCVILHAIRGFPSGEDGPPSEPANPAELLLLSLSDIDTGDDMPAKLEASAERLTLFLHYCWLYNESMQDEVLRWCSS